jgi:hypothetical protein
MTVKRQKLAPEIAEIWETPLTVEAYEQRMATPPTDEEIAEVHDLVRWFVSRYPTAKERFAYVRRKYAEWTRDLPGPAGRLHPRE